MLLVFAARFILVVLGYLSLESYLDRKPLAVPCYRQINQRDSY